MHSIRKNTPWNLLEQNITPQSVFMNRRDVIKAMGFLGAAAALAPATRLQAAANNLAEHLKRLPAIPAPRNAAYQVTSPITPELTAGTYNNFYEFSTGKEGIWELAENFKTMPWKIEVSGLVQKPQVLDVEALLKRMPLEERVYRFRCVEAWSMVVPWIGFPLSKLIKELNPLGSAKYVKLSTFMRPEQAPRQKKKSWLGAGEPWPYTEGLTMAEAMNELTLMVVGSYGHTLPKPHGAPIRLIVPWKYGFKNIKSIDRIEFTDTQPKTFWNTIGPSEYGFTSNVNPNVPHPRWSQAFERDIATGRRKPTLLFNGYQEQVMGLYS